MLLALTLLSYQFKHILPWNDHVDMTVALSGVLLVALALGLFSREVRQVFNRLDVWLVLAFVAYACLSLRWASGGLYSQQKALYLIYYFVPSYVWASWLIQQHPSSIRRDWGQLLSVFLGTILVLAIFVSLAQYTYEHTVERISRDIFQTNYLVTGQTIGFGALLGLFWGLPTLVEKFPHHDFLIRAIGGVLLGLCIFSLTLTGGRGPLIGVISSIFFVFAIKAFQERPTLRTELFQGSWILMGVILGSFMNLQLWHGNVPTIVRIHDFMGISGAQHAVVVPDASTQERLSMYLTSGQAIIDHPFVGLGIGSWPTWFAKDPHLWHPHNLFLEVLTELGLVGLAFVLLYIGLLLRKTSWRFVWAHPTGTALFALWVFSAFNAMKSGDLIDNIFLLVWSAILQRLQGPVDGNSGVGSKRAKR